MKKGWIAAALAVLMLASCGEVRNDDGTPASGETWEPSGAPGATDTGRAFGSTGSAEPSEKPGTPEPTELTEPTETTETTETEHTHTFDTVWSQDAERHWHAAACGHPELRADDAAHTYDADGYCTVCDAEKPRRRTVTVRFDTAGGSAVPPVTVESGTVIAAPVSEKTGYLLRWSYDFTRPVTEDMTVTAVWLPRTDTAYRVEHWLENAGDDGYTLEAAEALTGTTDEKVTAVPRSFAHFSRPGETAGIIAPDGSLVLRVYYPRRRTQISFRTGGVDGLESPAPMTVKYGQTVTLPVSARTGYRCRWHMATDPETGSGTEVTNGPWLLDDEAVTLDAVWLPESYTVTLDPAGGELGSRTLTVSYGQPYLLPTPTRTGYTFLGWCCGETAVAQSGTWTRAEDCRLCAVWQADRYRVTFDLQGGTLTAAGMDVTFGAAYAFPEPERAGYRFLGWECEGVLLGAAGIWYLPYDVTLLARWEALSA